jgi:hypothetical protein
MYDRRPMDPQRRAQVNAATDEIPALLKRLHEIFTTNPALTAEQVGADAQIRTHLDTYPVSGRLRDSAFLAAIHGVAPKALEVAALFYPGEEKALRGIMMLIKSRRPDWLPRTSGKELGAELQAVLRGCLQNDAEWQHLVALFPPAALITDFSQLIQRGSTYLRHLVEQARPSTVAPAAVSTDPFAKFLITTANPTPASPATDPFAKFLITTLTPTPSATDVFAKFSPVNGDDPRKKRAQAYRKVAEITKSKGIPGIPEAADILAQMLEQSLEQGGITLEQADQRRTTVGITPEMLTYAAQQA